MTKVTAFQTSDGQVHTDETAATYHEFELELRGVIQSHPDYANLRNDQINIQCLCKKISHNSDLLVSTIHKFRRKLNGISSRKTKSNSITII